MRRVRRRGGGAGIALLVAALALPAGAGAQPQPPPPTGDLLLASQTPWVGPGQELVLRLDVRTAAKAADLELAVAVYRAVRSRSEFLLTIRDRLAGSPLSVTTRPLAELQPDAAGAVVARLPVQDPNQPADASRIRLRDEGVYPVRVELRVAGGGPVVDRLTTHLVHARPPAEGGVPLRFAWVLPFTAPPALQPDGNRDLDRGAAGRLATMAQALEAQPDVPLVLAPTPETVEALAASSDEGDRSTAAALARAGRSRQLVGGTYVDVAPGAFAAAGGEAEFSAQLDRGRAVLERLLGSRPDTRTWVSDEAVDEAALDRLRTQHVDRLVLPARALSPVDLPVTLAQPFEVHSRSLRRPAALAADDDLRAHLVGDPANPDDPVLRAHQLLADLAVVYFDSPSVARGVVALAPRDWAPSRPFLDAVLAGLASSPVVRASTLDDVFASVRPAPSGRSTLVRSLQPAPPPAALHLGEIREVRSRLEGFGAMLDADNPRDDQFEQVLLASQSVDLRPRQRTTYLRELERRLSAELEGVAVPSGRTITLTARRGTIPVTLQRRSDYPVTVLVTVSSDKLAFPEGRTRRVHLNRRITTERFVVEARTSGAFPLRITLSAPEAELVVARTRFTVRSTAASGVGIALSVGAAAVLLGWWARHLVRGRRNRRLVPA